MVNWKLKARITERYGTQVDFAQKIGIREVDVSRVVRGRKQLQSFEQQMWAEALDCRPKEIFGAA